MPGCSPTWASPGTVSSSHDLGIAPFELLVSNLYPFEATVASGAPAARVRGADRHRRPGHGPRRRQEPRQRRRDHRPLDVCGGGGGARGGRVHAGAAAPPRGPGLRPYRQPTTPPWRPGSPSDYAPDETARGDRMAGRGRRPLVPPGGAPLRREPAPAGGPVRWGPPPGPASPAPSQLHGKAMSYNNYVDAAAAWRAAHRLRQPCVAIIKHSNPVRDRGRRRPGARRTARPTPATRCRPTAA